MRNFKIQPYIQNLIRSIPLLLSAASALTMFLLPTPKSLAINTIIFIAVAVISVLGLSRASKKPDLTTHAMALLMTLLITFMGIFTFRAAWETSDHLTALAGNLNIPTSTFLLMTALVLSGLGFYAAYRLSVWIITLPDILINELLPECPAEEFYKNLKRNWVLPVSAMAFFYLAKYNSLAYFMGMLITLRSAIKISGQLPCIWTSIKTNNLPAKVFYVLSAVGICMGNLNEFNEHTTQALAPEKFNVIFALFGLLVALGSVFFVYTCLVFFWNAMRDIFKKNGLFSDITKTEKIVYSVLMVLSISLVVFAFSQSEAFYGTPHKYDIIYTSDSPTLIKGNVYTALVHPENDLRQPLFALFAAPFVGLPYLVATVLGASASTQAILINITQILLLFVANFMLAKAMKLSTQKRILFMLLMCTTYTQLLFTLMMEQYIVAYFYIVLCIYLVSQNQPLKRIVLWGAGGTLLTSMIVLPFMSNKSPKMGFKDWLEDMFKYGVEFVSVLLLFCRFDIILNLTTSVSFLSGFTGKSITIQDKLYQYTNFVASCITAPSAGINPTAVDHISWQLNQAVEVNLAGVVILILVAISAVLNKNKKSSRLAAAWVCFSVVMLLVLGWGTQENGLILYSLYFGWAFIALLFQLLEKIEDMLKVKFLMPATMISCAAILAAINLPAIIEMIRFASSYYPT